LQEQTVEEQLYYLEQRLGRESATSGREAAAVSAALAPFLTHSDKGDEDVGADESVLQAETLHVHVSIYHRPVLLDPDPGSSAFLTPGSGIGTGKKLGFSVAGSPTLL
jgi:hypothetical protein